MRDRADTCPPWARPANTRPGQLLRSPWQPCFCVECQRAARETEQGLLPQHAPPFLSFTPHAAAFAMGYACELSGQPREVPPLRSLGAPEGCEWSWAQGWDEARARRLALAETANDVELALLGVRRTYAPPVDFDMGG